MTHPPPRMNRPYNIQYCRRIHDAKKSNVNVSEDRIKENFIKRFLKQIRSVSGRQSVTESFQSIYTSRINRNKSLQWIDKCHPSLVSFGVLVNNYIII